MSHGAAAGGEGEEAEEAEEEEEDEEEESAPPEFDARCQATPLELVRARACVRAWKCFRGGWLCLIVCARAFVRIRGDRQSAGGAAHRQGSLQGRTDGNQRRRFWVGGVGGWGGREGRV